MPRCLRPMARIAGAAPRPEGKRSLSPADSFAELADECSCVGLRTGPSPDSIVNLHDPVVNAQCAPSSHLAIDGGNHEFVQRLVIVLRLPGPRKKLGRKLDCKCVRFVRGS